MAKRVSAQLFVSRLSAYTTDQSLRQLFSPFGQIKEARLIRDPETKRPKGFGFITFESEDDARKASKSLDGKLLRTQRNNKKAENLRVVKAYTHTSHHVDLFAKLLQIVDGRLIFVEVAKNADE